MQQPLFDLFAVEYYWAAVECPVFGLLAGLRWVSDSGLCSAGDNKFLQRRVAVHLNCYYARSILKLQGRYTAEVAALDLNGGSSFESPI